MVTFLKLFLVNVISAAQGFGVALLLREHYWAMVREQQREEFVPVAFEYEEPEPVEESEGFEEPPPPEPVLESEIPIDSSSMNADRKIDEIDETLLPAGFKVESILENMSTSGVSEPNPEQVPDFSTTPQAADSLSASPDAFDESGDEEDFTQTPAFESESLPTIDIAQETTIGEGPDDFEHVDGVSSLAVELLGKDFDFEPILNKSQTALEEPQELAEVAELDTDAYQTENVCLSDAVVTQESTNAQMVHSPFPGEMVEVSLIGQDHWTDQVFTIDSLPMLPSRRRKKGVGSSPISD